MMINMIAITWLMAVTDATRHPMAMPRPMPPGSVTYTSGTVIVAKPFCSCECKAPDDDCKWANDDDGRYCSCGPYGNITKPCCPPKPNAPSKFFLSARTASADWRPMFEPVHAPFIVYGTKLLFLVRVEGKTTA